MPEEYDNKQDHGSDVTDFEELITKIAGTRQLQYYATKVQSLPNGTVRCKGQPSLKDKSSNSSPINKNISNCDQIFEVCKRGMVYDEWKGMHQGQEKESIGCPSVEDL